MIIVSVEIYVANPAELDYEHATAYVDADYVGYHLVTEVTEVCNDCTYLKINLHNSNYYYNFAL